MPRSEVEVENNEQFNLKPRFYVAYLEQWSLTLGGPP